MRFSRNSSNLNRFDNYREMNSKFDSVGKCGHGVKKGDIIGYHKIHGVRCATCWKKWVLENWEAHCVEQGYMNSPC